MPNSTLKTTTNGARTKNAQKSRKIWLITPVILIIILILFLTNKTAVIDWFKGIGYNPTPAMLEVKNSLNLTPEGDRIFRATRALLASRDDFNNSCESHDEAVSVLGCYTGDRIYVYNVEDETLKGIRESTSAHELLHAVWTRLTGLEKSKLVPLLESTYQKHPEMQETIESYPEEERIGELYVRLATQVKDLPETLESHYAKYFTNQDAVVAFYDSYIAPFNELKAQIEKLRKELDALEKEIKDRSDALDARLKTFDEDVDEFNSCADTAGCFTSNYAFASRRAELVAEQTAINAENSSLNSLIDEYNQKADVYNSSIARSSDLQNLINSNSPTSKIEE